MFSRMFGSLVRASSRTEHKAAANVNHSQFDITLSYIFTLYAFKKMTENLLPNERQSTAIYINESARPLDDVARDNLDTIAHITSAFN